MSAAFRSYAHRSLVVRATAVATIGILLAAAPTSCSQEGPQTLPFAGDAYVARTLSPLPKRGAFVSNSYSDTISVIDREAGVVVATYPVGRDPVGIDGPHRMVFVGTDLLVPLSYPPAVVPPGPHAAHGSSARPGYLLRLPVSTFVPSASVRLRENPGDVILSDDRTQVIVSHFDLSRVTKLVPIETRRATLRIFPADFKESEDGSTVSVCVAPHGITSMGAFVYVACYGEDAIAKVNIDTKEVVRTYIHGSSPPETSVEGPYALLREEALVRDAGASNPTSSPIARLAITNNVGRNVKFFDPVTNTFVGGFSTVGAPYFAANGLAGRAFVLTQTPDELVEFEWATGAVIRKRSFADGECPAPHEIAYESSGDRLLVVCEGDKKSPGKVVALSASMLDPVRSIDVGVYPDKIVLFGDDVPAGKSLP